MARTTIKDIARECGVSLSTVSLVLNNNPRISASTREKVLKAVEKHAYQPNAFARSLASQSSRMLSVVVPDLNHVFADVYFGEILSGLYERASERGFKVLFDVSNQRFIAGQEHVNLLKSKRVDGMLYIGASVHDSFLFDLEAEPFPSLLVNHYYPGRKLNYVAADYVRSAQLAAEHLVGLGHRKIGVLCGTNTNTAIDFKRHFEMACVDLGVSRDGLMWADGWFTEQGGYEGAQWLLDNLPDLTAIMAGNDKMAIGAMRQLKDRKRSVPDDVSVVGMDDIQAAAFSNPGLTTIRHNLYQIGAQSVDALLSLIHEEETTIHRLLPVELVVRESTAPARGT